MLLNATAANAQAPAHTPSDGLLADLMRRLAAIPERRCTFREEKRIAALEQPLISEGRLVYVRPSHLEKITTSPEPETLIVDGDRLALTTESEASQSFSLSGKPELAALVDAVRGMLSGDLAMLQRYYRVQASGNLNGWQLVLLPADGRVANLVRSVVVDGVFTHIASFRTNAANDDVSVMTIEDTH